MWGVTKSRSICYYSRGAGRAWRGGQNSSGIRTRAGASEFWVHQMMVVGRRRAWVLRAFRWFRGGDDGFMVIFRYEDGGGAPTVVQVGKVGRPTKVRWETMLLESEEPSTRSSMDTTTWSMLL